MSKEFTRRELLSKAGKVGAGAQFMSGSFLKSVAGSGGGGVLVSFFPAQPKSLGHCVLSNI